MATPSWMCWWSIPSAPAKRRRCSWHAPHINQVIAEANAALEKSAVRMQYRLAHAAEVSWNDSVSMSYSSALSALRNDSDGYLDQVHALRDQYAADMVSLWVNPPLPGSGSIHHGDGLHSGEQPARVRRICLFRRKSSYAGGRVQPSPMKRATIWASITTPTTEVRMAVWPKMPLAISKSCLTPSSLRSWRTQRAARVASRSFSSPTLS